MRLVLPLTLFLTSFPAFAQNSADSTIQNAPATPPLRIHIAAGTLDKNALTKVPPSYPDKVKKKHVQGTVVLHVLVSATGRVEDATVESGPDLLREAALDAARQWRYEPYLLNGKPVAVDAIVMVNFKL